MDGTVQVILAALLFFEHDPNTPKKMLAPSTALEDVGCVKANEGVIVSSATRSFNITVGARNAKRDSIIAVR